MLLHHATWQEVEDYLADRTAIIMPIGSTEQHGPNGLIGTDAVTAEHIAGAVGDRTGALVAPTISVGMAQHHMAFTGSMTVRPSTLILIIREYVESLSRHGFDRFYFINGHGGNISTINSAFQEIYAGASLTGTNVRSVTCALRNWFMAPGVSALSKELYGTKEGSHATPSEIAVTQYLFPDAIKDVPDFGPPSNSTGGFADAADYRAKFPDGRIRSWPQMATPEAGKRIFDAAVEDLVDDFKKFEQSDL